MATDYEKFYRDHPHGLGGPTKEFVEFFNLYTTPTAKVLDVGCGQGRDALFIARLGHDVCAIDLSSTGVNDLILEAQSEDLRVVGVVADIREYEFTDSFDVIIVDRTLHMLASNEQVEVLENLLCATKAGAHVLIADEPSNIPVIIKVFEQSNDDWIATLARKGFLFMLKR